MYRAALAHVHHAAFGDLARSAGPAIVRWLRSAGIRGGVIVDLGCGSGIVAARLAASGYDVLGVDPSAAMLRIARAVAPGARFVRRRAEDVALPRCGAVVSTGEAMTYLSRRRSPLAALRHHIRRAARALEPGGLFIFDAIVTGRTPMTYCTWRAGRDWTVLVEVREDARRRVVSRAITVFTRVRGSAWRRDDEQHRVGVYEIPVVRALLQSQGFSVRISTTYGRTTLPPRRVVFLARLESGRASSSRGANPLGSRARA